MSEKPMVQFPTSEETAAWLDAMCQIWSYDHTNLQAAADKLGVPWDMAMQLHQATLLADIRAELRRGNEHLDERDDCPRCQENKEMRALQLKMARHALKHMEDEEKGDEWKPPT